MTSREMVQDSATRNQRTSSSYADAESDRMAISENTTDEFTWQSSLMERNNDGLSPAREGGLTSDQDFALANYKMFKVAAGKTLKSIIISCNVRMAPMRIEQVRELLKYDEMNLDEMGDPGQRTAVFAIMSDTDKGEYDELGATFADVDIYVNAAGADSLLPNRAINPDAFMDDSGFLSEKSLIVGTNDGKPFSLIFGNIVALSRDETGELIDMPADIETELKESLSDPLDG